MSPPTAFPLSDTRLSWEDMLVIAIYFVMVIGVGIWSSCRSKRDNISGYFLAGRSMHWIPVGASLFASNIGSGHFIGLAGSGASTGVGIAGFELNALYVLLLLGWFFVPVYISAGVYTMPEYLRKRFGGQRIRIYLSVLALLLYVFTKISADLFAGAIFIEQSMGVDLYAAVTVLLAIAAVFTIAGGLAAVIWTDFVQTILMVIGACILMVLSLYQVGGYENLMKEFGSKLPDPEYVRFKPDNQSCSAVPEDFKSLVRSPKDPNVPWPGMLLGLTINAVWYWCADQVIVQRALSAKNLSHAKGGCILAAYLKLLPLFLLVLPGMAARVLYTNTIGCSDPAACNIACNNKYGCSNVAYPMLVMNLMPKGLRGLMLSVMLAALMSSLTSIFNSSSTLFTMDIWTRIRKQATDIELLIVGRVFVLVLVVISIAWIPIIQSQRNSQLFHYIQSVTSYLAPPVCAVYVLAVFWARINEKGAFWGLMVGLAVGLTRFVLDIVYQPPLCGEADTRPSVVGEVHYLHFGCILFLISLITATVVSLLTDPIPTEKLHRLTFWTRNSETTREDISSKPKGVYNIGFEKEVGDDETQKPVRKISSIELEDRGVPGETKKRNPLVRAAAWICGVPSDSSPTEEVKKPSPEEEVQEALAFTREKPLWKTICCINAIIAIVIATFIIVYFSH